ncbi:MAG: VWA domain-containing protein, partial [Bacteroides sp.]|nr:VWA domain-containing protein [Bacteroides sp.]
MKNKVVLLLFAFSFMLELSAQQFKPEKRIFMLDATSSMNNSKVKGDEPLWDVVKRSLESAIEQVEDTSTVLVVAPFWQSVNEVWTERATDKGKASLIKKINSYKTGGRSTNICGALEKGYSLLDKNYVNYLFLMTDGAHNTANTKPIRTVINNWAGVNKEIEAYGFYVMLHDAAKDDVVKEAVKSQINMWIVNSADININLFKLPRQTVYNPRADKNKKIKIIGPIIKAQDNFSVLLKLQQNDYYELEGGKSAVNTGEIIFRLKPKDTLANIPDEVILKIKVETENKDEFSFMLPTEIT